jgi:hypothetical protein
MRCGWSTPGKRDVIFLRAQRGVPQNLWDLGLLSTGIWCSVCDHRHPQKDSEEERRQDGVYARLFVDLAAFPTRPDKGDFATVNGTAYTVFDVEIDPAGAGLLSLKKHG